MATVSIRAGIGLGVALTLGLGGAAVVVRGNADLPLASSSSVKFATVGATGVDDDARPGPAKPRVELPTLPVSVPRSSTSTSVPATGSSTTSTSGPARTTSTTVPVPKGGIVGEGLYVANADGSDVHRVSIVFGQTTWSPDGTRLAYGNGGHLQIVNADGSGRRTIAAADRVVSAEWSPDGAWIAYHSATAAGGVYRIRADGSGPPILVDPAGKYGTWTPDGRVVVVTRANPGEYPVMVIYDHDGARRVLVSGDAAVSEELRASPSPDGRMVAYMSDRIMVVAVDGTGARALTDHWGQEYDGSPPVWSPDSHRLAIIDGGDTKVLDIDGGGVRTIPGATNPSWSRDGRRLAILDEQTGRLRLQVVGADGSDRHLLVDSGKFLAIGPQWSPTGRQIVFGLTLGIAPAPGVPLPPLLQE